MGTQAPGNGLGGVCTICKEKDQQLQQNTHQNQLSALCDLHVQTLTNKIHQWLLYNKSVCTAITIGKLIWVFSDDRRMRSLEKKKAASFSWVQI